VLLDDPLGKIPIRRIGGWSRSIPKDPRWIEAVQAERECQLHLEDTRSGTIDHELALRDLQAAIAKREWMAIDFLFFGSFLHDDKHKGPSRRGRPPDPEVEFKSKRIAAYTMLLELEGMLTKAAVIDGTQVYGVKRSTVFAARKQWCPQLRKLGFGQIASTKRRRKIKWFRDLEQPDPRFASPINFKI